MGSKHTTDRHGALPVRIAVIGSRGLLSEYSGIESMLREICPRLVRRGHSVTVFGNEATPRSFEGVSLARAASFGGKYTETLSRSFCSTLRALVDRFDLLHFHDVAPALYSPLSRLRGVPSLLTLHSLDWRSGKWPAPARTAIKVIERIAVSNASELTAVSPPLRDYVQETYRRECVVLPNVVERRPHTPLAKFAAQLALRERGYVLYVGRLVPEKDARTLIEAYHQVRTDLKLVITGDDRYSETYAGELRRIADPSKVLFTGHVSAADLCELYSNAHLFVLPSRIEGCSMALLEAMAHGTPVLVSDIPGNICVVGDDGHTFRTGDRDDLATQLQRLLGDLGETARMRNRLERRTSTATSWDEIAARYEGIYERVLKA